MQINEITGALKNRRKELKLTLQDVAIKIGKKRQYVATVENGANVKLGALINHCEALNLNLTLTENVPYKAE